MMSGTKDPIFYGKRIVDGITITPNSRDVIRKAIEEGLPIEVHLQSDYINLYHIFDRRNRLENLGLQMVRQLVGKDKWLLFITSDKTEVPKVEKDKGFDPKRGRYKQFAAYLQEGTVLTFSDRDEAMKAHRAWRLYIPKAERKHLRGSIRVVAKTKKFMVSVYERAG